MRCAPSMGCPVPRSGPVLWKSMTKRQLAEAIQTPYGSGSSQEPATSKAALCAALAGPRPPHRHPIGELLTGAGFLNDTGVHRALAAQENRPTARLGTMLVTGGEI